MEYKTSLINARTNSEFNVQANLFSELRKELEPFGFKIFGEVRLMSKEKTGGHFNRKKNCWKGATRKQKGRLDIAIFKNGNLVCAIEVKNKKTKGWQRQKKKYTELGVPKIFLCYGGKNIDNAIKDCKNYLSINKEQYGTDNTKPMF